MRKLNFKLHKRGLGIALTLGLILVVVTAAVVPMVAAGANPQVTAYVNKLTGETRIFSNGVGWSIPVPAPYLASWQLVQWPATASASASASIIGGGGKAKAKDDKTNYAPAFSDKENEAEPKVLTPMAVAGTISNFYIQQANTTGRSVTYTVRMNQANTGVTCTVSGAALTGSDLTHSVNFAAGDTISIVADPASSGGTDAEFQWSAKFVSAP